MSVSSYATVPFETLSPSKGVRSKHNGIQFQMVSRIDRSISTHAYTLRSVCRCVCEVKGKRFRISSFKGNIQNDGGDSSNKSKRSKNPVKISTAPQIKDETLSESTTAHDLSVSYASESDKTISGSKVIRRLFEKWLNILHTGAANETGNDVVEGPPQVDPPREQKTTITNGRREILKVVLCYFLGLDATFTIPLIIFVPLYLAINVVYGTEVSRELTPLWVIGPLIVALYVKLVRGIVALYVFSFKQTIKIIKNLPTYYSIAYEYIVEGRLKEEIRARLLQPMVNLRNADYKELSMTKLKVLQEWLMEKYLDYVESIWPYYCRMIRFLKSANLI
ncbi:hypothetical protein RND81_10G062200 [Saponaria officinalis]|uniref:Uncharacterized protein n=1 Tax=Saponaria officinalis TaxID=3572 RepID=A0AAW1HYM5_SAPOF